MNVRGNRSLTLTQKVAGATLLLFFCSIWPLAYFTTAILEKNLGKVLADQQYATVSAVAHDLDHKLRLRIEALNNEASGLPIDFLNSTFVGQHYLAHRRSLYSLFSNGVVLMGRDGSAIADYPPLPGRSQGGFKNREYFKRVMSTGLAAVGKPELGQFSKQPEVAIAVPVRAPMGDIVGVLAGYIDLDDPTVFGNANAKIGNSGRYLVFSVRDRLFVSATDSSLALKPLSASAERGQLARYAEGGEGSAVGVNADGVRELSSAKRLQVAEWAVVGMLPTDESFAPVYSMQRQIYIAAAVLSLLAAFLMWRLVRHHLLPVEEASALMRDMISGQAPLHSLPVSQDDEVGELLSAFNELQGKIHEGELSLRDNEEKFRVMFEASPVGIALNDIEGAFVDANAAILQMLGYSREEFLRLSYWDITGGYRPQEDEQMLQLADNTRYGPYAMEYLHKNATHVPVLLSGMVVRDRNGRKLIWSLAQNLTEHLHAERSLRLSAKVFEHSGEAILITDADNRIVSINPAFTKITGYRLQDVRGKSPDILSSGNQDDNFYQAMWNALEQEGHWQGEVWNRRKNGEIYPEWLTITTMKDEHGRMTNYIGIFSDITERKKTEESIRYLAQHDALTGLPNRLLLTDRLSQALMAANRNGTSFAVMFIDLDRFKNINDSLGHKAGDLLLQEVGKRLTSSMRTTDTVSRQGGDEFVILAPAIEDAESVAYLASKLIEILSRPYRIDNHDLTVTPSIGITLYPQDGGDVETLLKNADAAMYSAKNSGRNNFRFFTQDMNMRALEFLLMENNLRTALERREFILHYQPQVDAESGVLIGVEALVRWKHPEFGMVSPDKFIPIAEESGLILQLGEWVLNEACRQGKVWQDAGYCVPIAVNLSAIQFHRTDIIQSVRLALELSEFDPRYLELEVTESAIMQTAEKVIDILNELKAMGVKLAVDDFGTGYSSLSYLKRFPIDKLKVDQSFVRDIVIDEDDAQICCAVIGLAHSLRLSVVAEGVEHEAQLAYLRGKNCNAVQGYLVSRPLSAQEMTALFRAGKALF